MESYTNTSIIIPNILYLETIFSPKKVNSLKITRVPLTSASILIPHSNHKSPKTIGINTRTPKNIYIKIEKKLKKKKKKPNNSQETRTFQPPRKTSKRGKIKIKTPRGCLVSVSKQQFSVFKQYFTYFHTFFHPHIHPHKFLNNNFQFLNTYIKRPQKPIFFFF